MAKQPEKTFHLILFMTRNVSLKAWDRIGSLDREVALYKAFVSQGHRVSIVSYGSAEDLKYTDRLGGVKVLCNRWGLPRRWYESLLPWLFPGSFRACDVIKTNQMNGSEVAWRTARFWRKPLIARCGFLYSVNTARERGEESPLTKKAIEVEREVFPQAHMVMVTTGEMKKYVCEKYPVDPDKVYVTPNYVDTDLFKPVGSRGKRTGKICFVGRLAPLKNLMNLVEAIDGMDVVLQIIGGGSMRSELEAFVRAKNLPVSFLGNIANQELPAILNGSDLFVLPSLYEGHPKALLEAMSCGLPAIGANSPGIREVLTHRETGYLCGLTREDLTSAILDVLQDDDLRVKLGENARRYILNTCSLEKISQLEISLIKQILSKDENER